MNQITIFRLKMALAMVLFKVFPAAVLERRFKGIPFKTKFCPGREEFSETVLLHFKQM